MQWKAVDSSQISEVGYDSDSETLGIRFKAKGHAPATEYHYSNVEPKIFEEMLRVESVGKYFAAHVKGFPEKYPYQRIVPDSVDLTMKVD